MFEISPNLASLRKTLPRKFAVLYLHFRPCKVLANLFESSNKFSLNGNYFAFQLSFFFVNWFFNSKFVKLNAFFKLPSLWYPRFPQYILFLCSRNLTWRDVQHLIARSSRPLAPGYLTSRSIRRPTPIWTSNAANLSGKFLCIVFF